MMFEQNTNTTVGQGQTLKISSKLVSFKPPKQASDVTKNSLPTIQRSSTKVQLHNSPTQIGAGIGHAK